MCISLLDIWKNVLLDIRENVEWPHFYWPTLVCVGTVIETGCLCAVLQEKILTALIDSIHEWSRCRNTCDERGSKAGRMPIGGTSASMPTWRPASPAGPPATSVCTAAAISGVNLAQRAASVVGFTAIDRSAWRQRCMSNMAAAVVVVVF